MRHAESSEHGGSTLLRPRPQLFLIALVLVLTMADWFAASAIAPTLRTEWALTPWQGTLLTTSVQLGFVIGAVLSALFTLPDVMNPSRLLAMAALASAATTAAMAALAHDLWSGVTLRFLTGVALAAVYPVGMNLASSWFLRGRGLALGILIAALTLGSSLPLVLGGAMTSAWREVLYLCAALSVIGAILTIGFIRKGPLTSRAPRFEPRYVLTLLRNPRARLTNLGYLGHMWELYAVWVWLPAFFAASMKVRGSGWSAWQLALTCFIALGICGALGCVLAGWWGDRLGRARVAALAMLISGLCCIAAALLFGGPPVLLIAVMGLWGAAVIADSAMFSACMASVVDEHHVGTALTMLTAAGFLITIVTIQGLPIVLEHSNWSVAVAILGLGPLLGAIAMRRLSFQLKEPTRSIAASQA